MKRKRSRKFVVLAVIGAALIAASAAMAAWIIYDATLVTGSAAGSTTDTASHVGSILIVPGSQTQTQIGSPNSPAASIVLKVSNNDPTHVHTFKSSPDAALTFTSTPTTSAGAACTFAMLSGTPTNSVLSAINATLSGKVEAAGDTGTNYETLNAYNVSATAPAACAGVTVTFPLTGTLAN